MKKLFVEAEVEVLSISTLEEVMAGFMASANADAGNLPDYDGWEG